MASPLRSSSQCGGLYGLFKWPCEFFTLPLIPLKERRCNLHYVFFVRNPSEVSQQIELCSRMTPHFLYAAQKGDEGACGTLRVNSEVISAFADMKQKPRPCKKWEDGCEISAALTAHRSPWEGGHVLPPKWQRARGPRKYALHTEPSSVPPRGPLYEAILLFGNKP